MSREKRLEDFSEEVRQSNIELVYKFFEEGVFEEFGIKKLDLKNAESFHLRSLLNLAYPMGGGFERKKKLLKQFLKNPEVAEQYGITEFNPETLNDYVKLQDLSEEKQGEYKTLHKILDDYEYRELTGIEVENPVLLSDYLARILDKKT